MRTLPTILTIAFLTNLTDKTLFEKHQYSFNETLSPCKTEIDTLTKQIVYTTVDKEAINEGGQIALLRQYEKITLDSTQDDQETKFIIAFIVNQNGQITGERILKDNTNSIGQQMIKIAKSFKWTPAECEGRKVPMLVKIPLQLCFSR